MGNDPRPVLQEPVARLPLYLQRLPVAQAGKMEPVTNACHLKVVKKGTLTAIAPTVCTATTTQTLTFRVRAQCVTLLLLLLEKEMEPFPVDIFTPGEKGSISPFPPASSVPSCDIPSYLFQCVARCRHCSSQLEPVAFIGAVPLQPSPGKNYIFMLV